MTYWLLYDIVQDKKRLKLIQICKDYGLYRIQKSCFFGNMDGNQRKRMEKKISDLLDMEDQVCLIPVDKKQLAETTVWGAGGDRLKEEDEQLCFV